MSGGFLLRRGALPGPGKMHSIPALLQLMHGCCLSHRTFLFLQVTQDLGFKELPAAMCFGAWPLLGLEPLEVVGPL